MEMPSPHSVKDIHALAGWMTALGRFIPKSAEKGLPFFKILLGAKKFEWMEKCEKAFQRLKECLTSPPLLRKPKAGEVLYLYLAASEAAVSAVLVRAEGCKHQPIYYVSRLLQGAELNYPRIEKVAISLVSTLRELRQNFQAHPITILMDQSLKKILQSPDASGRLVKWAVELSEFGIDYPYRPTIEAQVLADSSAKEDHGSPPAWALYADGSSTNSGSGAGVVLINPQGDKMEYAIKFEFPASNNEAEYEALIAGIKMGLAAGANSLVVHSDSQLIVQQVEKAYEAKEEKMIKYLEKVASLRGEFQNVLLIQISREENANADKLAKLGNSMAAIDSRKITLLIFEESKISAAPTRIDPRH